MITTKTTTLGSYDMVDGKATIAGFPGDAKPKALTAAAKRVAAEMNNDKSPNKGHYNALMACESLQSALESGC